MNDHTAGYAELPRTAYLDHTLRRARTAAEQRSHRYVTLEHLLLALLDDPDAVKLVQTIGADLSAIKSTIADTVNNKMSALVVPDGRSPSFSYKFDSLFPGASEDAVRAGRREVDGAFALIAVAKDRDSSASAILAVNGFSVQAALQSLSSPYAAAAPAPLGPPAPMPRLDTAPRPAQAPAALREAPPQPGAGQSSGDSLMEEMLISVRNILDAEERKERGLPPVSPTIPMAPPPRAVPQQPRVEPQFRLETGVDRQAGRGAAGPDLRPQPPLQDRERLDARPRLEPVPSFGAPDRRHPPGDGPGGFADTSEPEFEHLSLPAPKRKSKNRGEKPARGRGETPAGLARVLEGLPRNARNGAAQIVQISLGKEEAAAIFARMGHRGQPQMGEPSCRAVTVRLSAPEGGFFIEGATPETQWILNRPSFLGEEAFGTWAWTVTPNETGSFLFSVSMSARDVDGNGVAGDLQLPEQAIKVRVHGSLWRGLAGFLSAMLLVAAGSGLTIAAWYALKITGKLPQ